MLSSWPNKDSRESFEISQFIEHYKGLPHGRSFEIVGRGDNEFSGPDYFLRDTISHERLGVELTSVYLDDRSVPDVHMRPLNEDASIPYDSNEIEKYLERIADAISEKIRTARSNYDTSSPLILSVYINEYISLWIDEKIFGSFVEQNGALFDQMGPFTEIVFWPLPTPKGLPSKALSVRSGV